MRKYPWLPILIAVSLLGGIVLFWDTSDKKQEPATFGVKGELAKPTVNGNNKKLDKPELTIDTQKDWRAIIVTDKGKIIVDLLEKEVPITVNNFVYLSQNNFYDNTIFHRVIKGFMIQGGDPGGTGTGGPGYSFADEKLDGEYTRGTVAMANSGPNTNGSQFFIMHADYPLPNNYVIFGRVVSGMDVVDKIAEGQVEVSPSGEQSSPIEPVVVEKIEIEEL